MLAAGVAVGERVGEVPDLAQVASIEVWRYSSLITLPSSAHGEAMIAGTRYGERSNVKSRCPAGTVGSGGGAGPGGTWS